MDSKEKLWVKVIYGLVVEKFSEGLQVKLAHKMVISGIMLKRPALRDD
jgi:hypothetical protein